VVGLGFLGDVVNPSVQRIEFAWHRL